MAPIKLVQTDHLHASSIHARTVEIRLMGEAAIWDVGEVDIATLYMREQGSLSSHLDIEVVAASSDWVRARMPVDNRTRQIHGRLHGGALVALRETVGSLSANLTLDQAHSIAVGLEINANYVRPVKSGFVQATARADRWDELPRYGAFVSRMGTASWCACLA